ncbi:MAG: hypothetical protein PHF25_05965 [Candidatus Margulisbacteria bacterium]|nr:hypothetical protein [Candidatus Margulisiibacteriota bacterium]
MFKKIGIGFMALLGAVGLTTNFVHAAPDPDLTNSLASTTSLLKDNAYAFIPYILGVFGAVITLTLIIKGIMWGVKKIRGTIK